MTIEELIGKLPPELRPYATDYLDLLIAQGEAAITEWITAASSGQWETAYDLLVSKMTTQQLLAEMKRLRVVQKEIAAQGAANTQAQQVIVATILRTLLTMLVAMVK